MVTMDGHVFPKTRVYPMPYWNPLPCVLGCGLKGDERGEKEFLCLPARSLERPRCTCSRDTSRGGFCPTRRQREPMGTSSICFECPAGVFARPVLRTIPIISGVNGRGKGSFSKKKQTGYFLTLFVVNIDMELDYTKYVFPPRLVRQALAVSPLPCKHELVDNFEISRQTLAILVSVLVCDLSTNPPSFEQTSASHAT